MKTLKKSIFIVVALCKFLVASNCRNIDTTLVLNKAVFEEKLKVSSTDALLGPPLSDQVYHFSSLDEALDKYTVANAPAMPPPNQDPGFASSFMLGLGQAHLSDDVRQAKKICDDAIAAGRFIDKLTGGDLVTMPIVMKKKIGQQDFYLIFQSAKIHPTYAEIEVYAKIDMMKKDFNGENAVLYFGAKGLKFSQEKGLIEGYIGLLADYAIRLGDNNDNAGFYLKKMAGGGNGQGPSTGTYVAFDCDGFKEMSLEGRFFLSRNWVIPVDANGVPRQANANDKSSTARVNAEISVKAQSWEDIYIKTSIDHFVLAKWDRISLFVGEAHIDLSSFQSPMGTPYGDVGNPLWEGVYIKSIGITLPKPFKRTKDSFASTSQGTNPSQDPPQTERIKVTAEHLAIGQSGVSGNFTIESQVPLIGGAIADGEWGWSLDGITLVFENSDISGFGFTGQIGVPILAKEGPLKYDCVYSRINNSSGGEDDLYEFNVDFQDDPANPKRFPIWNAASVNMTSRMIHLELINDEFSGYFLCSGSLTIGNPNDYQNSPTGSMVKMPAGLYFTDLKVATRPPFLSVGSLVVNTAGSKVSGFPVTVTNIGLSTPQGGDNLVNLSFNILIKLMDSGTNTAEASGNFTIQGKYWRDDNGARHFVYNDFLFNGATVTIALPQFYCHGTLNMMRDDPVYGNGFSASVQAKIIGKDLQDPGHAGKFNIGIFAIFGSTEGYRYWMVDGFVGGEALKVPLFPPFYLNGFGGGAFHHMKPDSYSAPGGNNPIPGQSLSGIVYKPNSGTKLGLTFSTAISSTGNLMSGLLTCIIRFDQNMALQNITFWGTAQIMIGSDLHDQKVKNMQEKVKDNTKSNEQLQAQDQVYLNNPPTTPGEDPQDNRIFAKLGLSLDFTQEFKLHGYAEVIINSGPVSGTGTLDLLFDENENKWHFWLGGYGNGATSSDGFFTPDPKVVLQPVSVTVNYGNFTVSAHAYFLTGNDIPGPPPMSAEALAFFGPESDNRGLLECEGRSPQNGTGIAFGASAFFEFEKTFKGLFGSCVGGLKVDLGGGLGFDLALLKYTPGSNCPLASGFVSEGINGMRATGRAFVFINIEGGHFTCFPLPKFGIGVKIRFDIIKPSYFEALVKVDVGKEWEFSVEIGDECGTPCPGPGL